MQKKVKVKPNSKQQKITEQPDGSLIVHLKSPPVDGKANEELIRPIRKLASQYLQGFETSPCRFCFNEEISV
ncbi:DUF167 domain-containing protein [Halotia wernerae UHCC 0503]|nr:DUF167 domain-containing protein [Halotia wernerae UHCC 0503]